MYNLRMTVGRKFAYADDLAIFLYASNWQALERTLTQDMATLISYFYKLNTKKTKSAAFHL